MTFLLCQAKEHSRLALQELCPLAGEETGCIVRQAPQEALGVKNPSANAGVRGAVPSLGREDPPEEGRAAHCSILAWRIPWTEGFLAGVAKSQI